MTVCAKALSAENTVDELLVISVGLVVGEDGVVDFLIGNLALVVAVVVCDVVNHALLDFFLNLDVVVGECLIEVVVYRLLIFLFGLEVGLVVVKHGDDVFLNVLVELLCFLAKTCRAHNGRDGELSEGGDDYGRSVVTVELVENKLYCGYAIFILSGEHVTDVLGIAGGKSGDKVSVTHNEVDINEKSEVLLDGVSRTGDEHIHGVVEQLL